MMVTISRNKHPMFEINTKMHCCRIEIQVNFLIRGVGKQNFVGLCYTFNMLETVVIYFLHVLINGEFWGVDVFRFLLKI